MERERDRETERDRERIQCLWNLSIDDKVEHCLAASHSPTPSQQKESPSLSEQEDTLRNNGKESLLFYLA